MSRTCANLQGAWCGSASESACPALGLKVGAGTRAVRPESVSPAQPATRFSTTLNAKPFSVRPASVREITIRPVNQRKSMMIEVYVGGVSHEVWFRDTRDQRQVVVLNCLDRRAHDGLKLKQTFDYTPTKEEAEAIELEKLDGASLVLAVEEIKAANGGRLKFRGKIDRASVPKQALRNNGAGSSPAKTPSAGH